MREIKTYNGNRNLKRAGEKIRYTKKRIDEIIKCREDIIYFAENYMKIINIDKGLIKIPLYDYQKELLPKLYKQNQTVVLSSRQSGKTTSLTVFILHFILFNEHKNVALLANKASMAREILARIKLAYENMPNWLQQGVQEWNKGNILLENGCQVLASASSGDSIRGLSIALLLVDEVAAVENWDQFYASTLPTISSGKDSKICLISTAKGLNHYYKLWTDAKNSKNSYNPFEVNWWDIPGRDEAWKEKMIADIGLERFRQEFGNEFLGSSNTMISSSILQELVVQDPIRSSDDRTLKYYSEPVKDNTYVITVDVSRGRGLDNSAFVVIDITESPFNVVCTYYNPNISILMFPDLLMKIGTEFNNAQVLIETNDAGISVANDLYYDLEYENTVIELDEKNDIGIRTTRSTKSKGCSLLTEIIEKRMLLVNDENIVLELSGFISKGSSFEADKGFHDDLVMCLVIFAYFTSTDLFNELKDDAFSLKNEIIKNIDDEDMPFWITNDGGEIEVVQPQKEYNDDFGALVF